MARISDELKQRVRDATDLVELAGEYTQLRRAGADRMVGRCPLHDERTPSFTISPSKQLFKCFGCDAGGDALTLVELKEGLDFPAALEHLAQRAGIQLNRDDAGRGPHPNGQRERRARARELQPLDRAAAFYAAHLRSPRPEAVQAAEYLTSRGLGRAILDAFMIGYAPADTSALPRAARAAGFTSEQLRDVGLISRPRGGGPPADRFRGRLTFPVCDAQGRVLGFGARKLPGARGPKYVNSPTSAIFRKGDLLFGLHHARPAATRSATVIVVEGYLDALAMHQAGLRNTVALMGTAINQHQIAVLKQLAPTAVFMFDGDDPGRQAAARACELARTARLEVRTAMLPADIDPAMLLQEDGPDAIRARLADARPE